MSLYNLCDNIFDPKMGVKSFIEKMYIDKTSNCINIKLSRSLTELELAFVNFFLGEIRKLSDIEYNKLAKYISRKNSTH